METLSELPEENEGDVLYEQEHQNDLQFNETHSSLGSLSSSPLTRVQIEIDMDPSFDTDRGENSTEMYGEDIMLNNNSDVEGANVKKKKKSFWKENFTLSKGKQKQKQKE